MLVFATHLRQVLEVGSHRGEIEQLHRALVVGNGQPGSALLDSLSRVGVAAHLEIAGRWVRVKCANERSKVATLQLHRLEVVGIAQRLEVSLHSRVSKNGPIESAARLLTKTQGMSEP